MITEVLDRNVVAIPDRLASQHGIKPGSRVPVDFNEDELVFEAKGAKK